MEVGLSSLTECLLTISNLVTSSGPDAQDSANDRPPLADVGAWGAFSQLSAFQPVTPSARAVCPGEVHSWGSIYVHFQGGLTLVVMLIHSLGCLRVGSVPVKR